MSNKEENPIKEQVENPQEEVKQKEKVETNAPSTEEQVEGQPKEEVKEKPKKKKKRGLRGGSSAKKIAQLEKDLEEAEKDLVKVEDERNELKDKYLRLFAEFDNYKRRTAKERVDILKTASASVLREMLPILDDFDRAKTAAGKEGLPEGVQLIQDKLLSTLAKKGLKPMESNGQPFDAESHEAIAEIPAPTEEMKGRIIDTVEKGYTLNDKIIRYAKVVVGK
jgi:molecular chaperone GrpE